MMQAAVFLKLNRQMIQSKWNLTMMRAVNVNQMLSVMSSVTLMFQNFSCTPSENKYLRLNHNDRVNDLCKVMTRSAEDNFRDGEVTDVTFSSAKNSIDKNGKIENVQFHLEKCVFRGTSWERKDKRVSKHILKASFCFSPSSQQTVV